MLASGPDVLLYLLVSTVICTTLILISFYLIRIQRGKGRPCFTNSSARESVHLNVCIVLGSGGHTTEMLRLVGCLDSYKYGKRHYILSDTDSTSLCRVRDAERLIEEKEQQQLKLKSKGNSRRLASLYTTSFMPRSREVGQSYFTSVYTTLKSLFKVLYLIFFTLQTDLLLCNGPGVCLPVCAAVFLRDCLSIIISPLINNRSGSVNNFTPVIFVESICRVNSLSLTGKLLYHTRLADVILVQWPELAKKYPRVKYLGRF